MPNGSSWRNMTSLNPALQTHGTTYTNSLQPICKWACGFIFSTCSQWSLRRSGINMILCRFIIAPLLAPISWQATGSCHSQAEKSSPLSRGWTLQLGFWHLRRDDIERENWKYERVTTLIHSSILFLFLLSMPLLPADLTTVTVFEPQPCFIQDLRCVKCEREEQDTITDLMPLLLDGSITKDELDQARVA